MAWGSLASSPKGPARDVQLSKSIVGAWKEENTVATFLAGGGYKAVIYSADKKSISMTAEGTWWIKDGLLYNKIEKSQPPNVPPGSVFIDKIVDISPTSMTLIDDKGLKDVKSRTQ
jgi:hypothetical protein